MNPRVQFARTIATRDSPLRLYALLDAASCQRQGLTLLDAARAFADAGIRLVQYRDKLAGEESYLANARALRKLFPPETLLLLNDYPHLVALAAADGAHVGQADAAPAEARRLVGPDRILGVSTHSVDQALAANSVDVDYVAIGPVFATTTKADAESAVGLCGVQAARAVTTKPLVAIGGIDLSTAAAVRAAGADAVAVVSALLPSNDPAAVTARAQDFLARLK